MRWNSKSIPGILAVSKGSHMTPTRIPNLIGTRRTAAKRWIQKMHGLGLLFCLDDRPEDIVQIANGLPTFTPNECAELRSILSRLFTSLGDTVLELAFDSVSKTFHTSDERLAIAVAYL